MFRRLTVSFFAEWRKRNPGKKRATLTGFYNLIAILGLPICLVSDLVSHVT